MSNAPRFEIAFAETFDGPRHMIEVGLLPEEIQEATSQGDPELHLQAYALRHAYRLRPAGTYKHVAGSVRRVAVN